MSLLLEHVRLRLPLPDQQLAQLRAAEGEPFPAGRDCGGVDTTVGDGERVDLVACGHLIERKGAVTQTK